MVTWEGTNRRVRIVIGYSVGGKSTVVETESTVPVGRHIKRIWQKYVTAPITLVYKAGGDTSRG